MLKTRIITALILLAVLLLVIYSGSFVAFAVLTIVFFAASAWECLRLFGNKNPILGAAIWTAAFTWLIYSGSFKQSVFLSAICVAIWALRLTPSLVLGLPVMTGMANRLLTGIYGIAILGAFIALLVLFNHSTLYMFSVMAIVWLADIGAYFSGKAFGKRKLAPSISPGKSWEGAIGGGIVVLLACALTIVVPALNDTFAVQLYLRWGWLGFLAVLVLMVAASIVGDLFESQLKRRASMKDSSSLLPGHGGVLDRLDALIPTLPLAALIAYWM
ncbi:MAG: phosphatidate cytidylyltransferase [Pseudomonadota bacterium]